MDDTKILLGMMRPPTPPSTAYTDKDTGEIRYVDFVLCPCGEELWNTSKVMMHWNQGHFDKPVYATKEEMMDRLMGRLMETMFERKPTK